MITFDIQVSNDEFLLISTDGIFGGMNIHQITDFIMERYDKLETE
jgi:serine/threonine protein phosphatase PrpC